MKHLIEQEGVERVIIACKKSIKRQWVQEIEKFTDIGETFKIMTVDGTKKQREKTYEEFDQELCGILVMNYHLIMNDIDILKKLGFELLVIDEAHCVKARTGKLNKAMAQIGKQARYTIFLTGTPVMSRPDDVFGIVQIADPKYFGKWKEFEKKHIFREYDGRFIKDIGYLELDDLREQVQDIIIRRTEYEVSIELPSTVVKVIDCQKDKVQAEIETAISSKRRELIDKRDELMAKDKKTDIDKQKIEQYEGMIKGLIAADQACANDPSLFRLTRSKMMQKDFGSLVPDSYDISSKTQTLCDLVETILDADEKVVIFSKFETSTQLIKQELERQLKVPALLYTGKVDDETRDNNLDLFRDTDKYNILIGTDALAEGVNLQRARHLIHYDQADTPAIKTQRNGRVRRTGSQYGSIYVYDLVTENSKDTERLSNIEKKMGLVDGVVSIDQAQSESLKEAMKAS